MARNGLGVFLFYADSNALSLFPHPAVRRLPARPIRTSSDAPCEHDSEACEHSKRNESAAQDGREHS